MVAGVLSKATQTKTSFTEFQRAVLNNRSASRDTHLIQMVTVSLKLVYKRKQISFFVSKQMHKGM